MPLFTAGASLSLLLVGIKAVFLPKTNSISYLLNFLKCECLKRQDQILNKDNIYSYLHTYIHRRYLEQQSSQVRCS